MPVIILVGVIGNVMSLCVFSLTHLHRLSSSVYLSSLALADTGFLVALFVVWLSRVNVKLFQREGWCQSTLLKSHNTLVMVSKYTVFYPDIFFHVSLECGKLHCRKIHHGVSPA